MSDFEERLARVEGLLPADPGPVDGLDEKGRRAQLEELVVGQRESVRLAEEAQEWVDAVAAKIAESRVPVRPSRKKIREANVAAALDAAAAHRRVTVDASRARLAAYEAALEALT